MGRGAGNQLATAAATNRGRQVLFGRQTNIKNGRETPPTIATPLRHHPYLIDGTGHWRPARQMVGLAPPYEEKITRLFHTPRPERPVIINITDSLLRELSGYSKAAGDEPDSPNRQLVKLLRKVKRSGQETIALPLISATSRAARGSGGARDIEVILADDSIIVDGQSLTHADTTDPITFDASDCQLDAVESLDYAYYHKAFDFLPEPLEKGEPMLRLPGFAHEYDNEDGTEAQVQVRLSDKLCDQLIAASPDDAWTQELVADWRQRLAAGETKITVDWREANTPRQLRFSDNSIGFATRPEDMIVIGINDYDCYLAAADFILEPAVGWEEETGIQYPWDDQ
jgi:hypothetical protein